MQKLVITNLTFKFAHQQNYFFHDMNVTFESGKIYFIQGKNGIGKSTFFSILQGKIAHNALLSGSLFFDNKKYTIQNNSIDPLLCANIKTMLQDINKMLVNTMSVRENIELSQLPKYPNLKTLSLSSPIPKILHDFTIDLSATVHQLSGGQKQILAIIMTLQKPTKILLLDEPTAALDDNNSRIVMNFLETLATSLDLIILIITHDKEITASYTNHPKITIMKNKNNETRTIILNS